MWYSYRILAYILITLVVGMNYTKNKIHRFYKKKETFANFDSNFVFFNFFNDFMMVATSYKMMGTLELWVGALECR